MSALLIFSHANSYPATTYNFLFDQLRLRGFEIAAIDKYGHDPKYPVTNNWPHLVEQLRDLAQRETQRTGDKAWFVGHSLGGFLSLMVAAQFPELARGVVLMDSPVVSGWRADALNLAKRTKVVGSVSPGATSKKRRDQWASRDAALDHFLSKRVFAQWHPQVLVDYIDHGTETNADGTRVLGFKREIETAIYNTLPHHMDALLRAHPLQVPLAFIGGTHSKEIRQVGMGTTLRLSQGRVTMLEGTHLFPMEKPVATAAAIEAAILSIKD